MFCDGTASDREENSMTHELLGFTRSRPRDRGLRSCFYFSHDASVKNALYIRSKGKVYKR